MWIWFLFWGLRQLILGCSCKLGSSCKWRSIDIRQIREGERRGSKFLPPSSRQQRHWRSVAEAERASGAPPNQKKVGDLGRIKELTTGDALEQSGEVTKEIYPSLQGERGEWGRQGSSNRPRAWGLRGFQEKNKQKKTLRSAFYTECRRDQIFEVLYGLL